MRSVLEATIICKRIALYNSPTISLAVGRENNHHVFEGQGNFETDCRDKDNYLRMKSQDPVQCRRN